LIVGRNIIVAVRHCGEDESFKSESN